MNPLAAFAVAAETATAALKKMTQVVHGWGATNVAGGFSAMNNAAKMVASIFGTVLAPVLVILAAGIMAASEAVFGLAEEYMPAVIDAFVAVADATRMAVKGITFFAESLADTGGKIGDWIGEKLFGAGPPQLAGPGANQNGPLIDPDTGLPVGGAGAGGKKKKDSGDSFLENFRGIIQEMKQGIAPSGFGGIGDAAKKLQVQSFQSTIQAKLLGMLDKSIGWLEKIAQGIQNQKNGLRE